MKNRALQYTLIFLIIGVIVTALAVIVQRRSLHSSQQNILLARLADHVKNRLTDAGLSFEALANGDHSVDFSRDVVNRVNAAKVILQGAYDGKETELGQFVRPSDEDTRAYLKVCINEADNFIESANDRWNSLNATASEGAGTIQPETEAQFNTAYKKFQASLDKLAAQLNKAIKADVAWMNTQSWLFIIVLFVTFVLLALQLFRKLKENYVAIETNAKRIEEQTDAVEHIAGFIDAVSAGNYEVNLALDGEANNLANKLITMRDKLKENTESDRKRSWTTTGLAQIGEILRDTTRNSSELYDNIIRFIVKYTRSNQGGLFIVNEEEDNQKKVYLELIACYAFERKKYLSKRIEAGEGLVGQCYLEGERIYLLDVPQEYVSITSGLGNSRPKALLIIPMKLNGKIYGVIELASFNIFEDFEIELIEKLGENVASTISTVRVNESTRILLEKNLQQAEEMKAQEEELHQNMEELEATQEEMRRKQTILERELVQSQEQAEALKRQEKRLTESQDTLQAIVDNIPRAIFWKDKDLYFMGCNKVFAKIAGIKSPGDIVGKSDYDMSWNAQAEAYRKDDLEVMNKREPKLNIEEVNVNSDGEESWVLTSKVPIMNQRDEVVAILGMFEDITQRKRNETDIAQKLKEREDALVELAAIKKQLSATR